MAKRAYIDIDLWSMTGTMQVVPGKSTLPRHDKVQLELSIAQELIDTIRSASTHSLEKARTNPSDPPDVLVDVDGVTTGIELTEILPPNRLEKDMVIESFRADVLGQLVLGEYTKNRVVHVFLVGSYAEKLKPRKHTESLARFLNKVLRDNPTDECHVKCPNELSRFADSISVRRENLEGDWRLKHPDHPLLIFDAQDTMIVPQDDVPRMVHDALHDKRASGFGGPEWLLVWSDHRVIASLQDVFVPYLGHYLTTNPAGFAKAFYMRLLRPGHVWHWPIQPEQERLFDRLPAKETGGK